MKVFVLTSVSQLDYEETKAQEIYENMLATPPVFSTLASAQEQAETENRNFEQIDDDEHIGLNWVEDGDCLEATAIYDCYVWRITEVDVL